VLLATTGFYALVRKLETRIDANACEQEDFLSTLAPGYVDLAILGAAALSLVLELAVIRWQGTVFEFTSGRGLKVIYSFTGGSDGGEPFDSALYRDAAGNLFGTTMFDGGKISLGVVFKVTPNGTESVLHTFLGGSDGAHPKGSLISDGKGNLYGTTSSGENLKGGTVFQITTAGVLSEVHTFSGSDGFDPNAGLTMDAAGNLFGTTTIGGAFNGGTVFSLTQESGQWKPGHLYSFAQANSQPSGNLVVDGAGNLYGTTYQGGANVWGSVFQLVPRANGWAEQTLYSFPVSGTRTGAYPSDGVLMDGSGNLFLTASEGGNLNDCLSTGAGCGTVIELSK